MPDAGHALRAKKLAMRGLALPVLALLSACGGGGSDGSSPPPLVVLPTPTPAPAPTPTPTPSTPAIPAPIATSPAVAFSQRMSPGINLGNSLDALASWTPRPATSSEEWAWGQPNVNQAIMNGYKAAGFKSVRIPVSWIQYLDQNDKIPDFWLARVKQVVDYARNADLYVIINVHHWDGDEAKAIPEHKDRVNRILNSLWTQIGNEFKDYDDHLLFAGTNEIGIDWRRAPPENCPIHRSYNQTFIDAVRATGGNNANRYLVVQSWGTNIDDSLVCYPTMPADTVSNKLMMEVHYYDPFNFTINGDSNIWQWGSIIKDPAAGESWANEAYTDAQFQKMKTNFFDKGVPVILGEYGAYNKPNFPGMNPYRLYWIEYVTRSAFQHGLIPMYWDTGDFLDRNTGAVQDAEAIDRIMAVTK